ncbi:hypothetical protein AMAG_16716 [Allomyces macrogynus ATCC 38327]|uniref:Late embryogenesis abundant protein LEA-2 subgroup domain-containing protein n=1 Tax=Allomyces macrogynus (strain ATCC 38327) TaxID=578462 RepID=A0A0L0TCG3_ALLM3|nr:hypothetical protein AMAG_16716 [Allomyces macrogynus ATCC 38327]|eukprot:KNE72234.1 hypothetical protein AMAG_16716 [Allomyces macrogynus ATCC 38327]
MDPLYGTITLSFASEDDDDDAHVLHRLPPGRVPAPARPGRAATPTGNDTGVALLYDPPTLLRPALRPATASAAAPPTTTVTSTPLPAGPLTASSSSAATPASGMASPSIRISTSTVMAADGTISNNTNNGLNASRTNLAPIRLVQTLPPHEETSETPQSPAASPPPPPLAPGTYPAPAPAAPAAPAPPPPPPPKDTLAHPPRRASNPSAATLPGTAPPPGMPSSSTHASLATLATATEPLVAHAETFPPLPPLPKPDATTADGAPLPSGAQDGASADPASDSTARPPSKSPLLTPATLPAWIPQPLRRFIPARPLHRYLCAGGILVGLVIIALALTVLILYLTFTVPTVNFKTASLPPSSDTSRTPVSVSGTKVTIHWDLVLAVTNPNSFTLDLYDVSFTASPPSAPNEQVASGSVPTVSLAPDGAESSLTFPVEVLADVKSPAQTDFILQVLGACGAPRALLPSSAPAAGSKLSVAYNLRVGVSRLKFLGYHFTHADTAQFDCPVRLDNVLNDALNKAVNTVVDTINKVGKVVDDNMGSIQTGVGDVGRLLGGGHL